MSPWTAALLAIIMQPWTLVAAAAVTAAQARLSTVGDCVTLVAFCLLATFTFIIMELYAVLRPGASTRLAALRSWLDTHEKVIIIIVCLVVGVWLTGHSIYQLAVDGDT